MIGNGRVVAVVVAGVVEVFVVVGRVDVLSVAVETVVVGVVRVVVAIATAEEVLHSGVGVGVESRSTVVSAIVVLGSTNVEVVCASNVVDAGLAVVSMGLVVRSGVAVSSVVNSLASSAMHKS